jgi:hypothetical protein
MCEGDGRSHSDGDTNRNGTVAPFLRCFSISSPSKLCEKSWEGSEAEVGPAGAFRALRRQCVGRAPGRYRILSVWVLFGAPHPCGGLGTKRHFLCSTPWSPILCLGNEQIPLRLVKTHWPYQYYFRQTTNDNYYRWLSVKVVGRSNKSTTSRCCILQEEEWPRSGSTKKGDYLVEREHRVSGTAQQGLLSRLTTNE